MFQLQMCEVMGFSVLENGAGEGNRAWSSRGCFYLVKLGVLRLSTLLWSPWYLISSRTVRHCLVRKGRIS